MLIFLCCGATALPQPQSLAASAECGGSRALEHMELSLSQNSEQKSRKSLFQKVKHSALKQHFKSAPAREKQRHKNLRGQGASDACARAQAGGGCSALGAGCAVGPWQEQFWGRSSITTPGFGPPASPKALLKGKTVSRNFAKLRQMLTSEQEYKKKQTQKANVASCNTSVEREKSCYLKSANSSFSWENVTPVQMLMARYHRDALIELQCSISRGRARFREQMADEQSPICQ